MSLVGFAPEEEVQCMQAGCIIPDLLPKGQKELYGKFVRDMGKNQGMQDEFKGLVGNEAKAEFRKSWALEKAKVYIY